MSLYVRVSMHVSVYAHWCGSVPFERRGQNEETGVERALQEEGRAHLQIREDNIRNRKDTVQRGPAYRLGGDEGLIVRNEVHGRKKECTSITLSEDSDENLARP